MIQYKTHRYGVVPYKPGQLTQIREYVELTISNLLDLMSRYCHYKQGMHQLCKQLQSIKTIETVTIRI